jgi:hypothetical protein
MVEATKSSTSAPRCLPCPCEETPATVLPATVPAFRRVSDPLPVAAANASDDEQTVHQAAVAMTQGSSPVRLVNSKRIVLNYEIKNVGGSGVTDVELWYTRDGRIWQKHGTAHQSRPPYVAEVQDEDLYGFTLVAHSGVGLGKRPPKEGDRPQVWVEVDTTRPNVRLLSVETGKDADARNLTVLWRATDSNLGPRPITISYATQADGPWHPIAARIKNTGRYVWQMPLDGPQRFLLRVEAVDQAGNVGMAQTPSAVLKDLAQPTTSILNVSTD